MARNTRFSRLSRQLGRRRSVRNPDALAASIGRKKYGKRAFQEKSAAGRRRG